MPKRKHDDEDIQQAKKVSEESVKRFKGKTDEDAKDREHVRKMIARQTHKGQTKTDQAVEKTRVTPQEEVARLLGWDILDAQTDLEEYDIKTFTPNARLIIVLGKRNTGKTVWITDFLYNNKDIWAYGLVFTRTKHNGYWQQFFPNHCIISHFDEPLLRRWMKIQEQRVTQDGVNNRVVLILDDMAADQAMR